MTIHGDPFYRLLTAEQAARDIPGIKNTAMVRDFVRLGLLTAVRHDPKTGAAEFLEADLMRAERTAHPGTRKPIQQKGKK